MRRSRICSRAGSRVTDVIKQDPNPTSESTPIDVSAGWIAGTNPEKPTIVVSDVANSASPVVRNTKRSEPRPTSW